MQVQDPQPFKNFTPPASIPAQPASSFPPAHDVRGHRKVLWIVGIVLVLIVIGAILTQKWSSTTTIAPVVQKTSGEASAVTEDRVNKAFESQKSAVPVTDKSVNAAFSAQNPFAGSSTQSVTNDRVSKAFNTQPQ